MARHRVGELVVASQPVAVRDVDAAGPELDLKVLARRSPLSWSFMVSTGLALALGGSLAAYITTTGFFGTALISSMLTTGGGLVFLGLHKRRALEVAAPPPTRALSASEQVVLRERSRRIRAILAESRAPLTFERLVEVTRWTSEAVLSALLFMKERGELVEDLDLDTGEWVYVAQEVEGVPGTAPSLMLEERRSRSEPLETEE
jgi:hypothetical protein